MVDFRINVGDPASRKTFQKVLKPEEASRLYGLKIGEAFKGEKIGMTGYEFEVTGGSDEDGFPLRADATGVVAKKAILMTKGVGFRGGRDGERRKKTVHINHVDRTTSQLNVKVTKTGAKPIDGFFEKKEKKKEED